MDPYIKIDNLSHFIHPAFYRKFAYMDEEKSVKLAEELLEQFILSGYQNIVVIESGTSPIIQIIKKLKRYKQSNITFIPIKIPRDLNVSLYKWLKQYLTKEEFEQRKVTLYKLCNQFHLEEFIGKEDFTIYDSILDQKEYELQKVKDFQDLLKETKIWNIFTNKFLVFDEYINAGTIIRNFNGMLRLFSNDPKFKLSAFCMFLDQPKKYKNISFTLYDNSSELKCYENGAYPFENRIDLISFYYFINKKEFCKIDFNKLHIKKDNKIDINLFYTRLFSQIKNNNLLEELRRNLEQEQVRQYVNYLDISRYVIKTLEKQIDKKGKHYEFLNQVFELYAPAWSPMPVDFHLDYWNAFSKLDITKIGEGLLQDYMIYRKNIMYEIIKKLNRNKKEWEERIEKIRKERKI